MCTAMPLLLMFPSSPGTVIQPYDPAFFGALFSFPRPLSHPHYHSYYISKNFFLLFWLLSTIPHQLSAGKTTISRLLFRFYDPLEGTVEMGGYDIKRYTQKSVRQVLILKCYHCIRLQSADSRSTSRWHML